MVILTRVNVGGVNNFAAGPLYGFTILFIIPVQCSATDQHLQFLHIHFNRMINRDHALHDLSMHALLAQLWRGMNE